LSSVRTPIRWRSQAHHHRCRAWCAYIRF
jgi:hypothetical protein